jgi:hypothetical protein
VQLFGQRVLRATLATLSYLSSMIMEILHMTMAYPVFPDSILLDIPGCAVVNRYSFFGMKDDAAFVVDRIYNSTLKDQRIAIWRRGYLIPIDFLALAGSLEAMSW